MTEILLGGNSNKVIRDGNTVIRQTGAWSPFVHQLLLHLSKSGFRESPVLIESGDGWERLSYIEGVVGNDPLHPFMRTDEVVCEAAKLLRRFHDVTNKFGFVPDFSFGAQAEDNVRCEVICHNDFAPYNCVFNNNHLVGMIDFDNAAPGTRLWDIAYAVYRFVPLSNDEHSKQLGWQPVPDRVARLKLFCDSYELENRSELIETVQQRLTYLIAYMRKTRSNLNHIPLYVNDLKFIAENLHLFSTALRM